MHIVAGISIMILLVLMAILFFRVVFNLFFVVSDIVQKQSRNVQYSWLVDAVDSHRHLHNRKGSKEQFRSINKSLVLLLICTIPFTLLLFLITFK